MTREFCPDCGTHLATRPQRPVIVVKVGTLDDPKLFGSAQMAIYTIDKQPLHQVPRAADLRAHAAALKTKTPGQAGVRIS